MPVSRTRELETPPARRRRSPRRDDDLARLRELHGVVEQVEQHLPQARRVAHDARRALFVEVAGEVELLVRRRAAPRGRAPPRRIAQVEGRRLELEPARLDLGEVEDVVDDAQQRVAARPRSLREVALLRRQLRVEQQPGHPDHGVHRRADLVAHRGQERALGLRRRLGLAPRLPSSSSARLLTVTPRSPAYQPTPLSSRTITDSSRTQSSTAVAVEHPSSMLKQLTVSWKCQLGTPRSPK